MQRALNVALALLSILILSLTGCSKRDKVIDIAEDDAEMNAAIAKARETLPHFWEVFEKHERGESDFALKVKITDKNGTEHFWASNLERQNEKIRGTISNDPNTVKTVKLGSRIEIPATDILDWMSMREEKMIGNYTLKPLLKHMPKDEANQFRRIMADP